MSYCRVGRKAGHIMCILYLSLHMLQQLRLSLLEVLVEKLPFILVGPESTLLCSNDFSEAICEESVKGA